MSELIKSIVVIADVINEPSSKYAVCSKCDWGKAGPCRMCVFNFKHTPSNIERINSTLNILRNRKQS